MDLLESYGRRVELEQSKRKANLKDQIMVCWNQNLQLMNIFAHSQNPEEVELKLPEHYYPDLFAGELEGIEAIREEEKAKNELALHKARMEEYAYRHNLAMKERGEKNGRNDTGKTAGNN